MDAASNRTSLTAPDGSISTYGYDIAEPTQWLGQLVGRIIRLRL